MDLIGMDFSIQLSVVFTRDHTNTVRPKAINAEKAGCLVKSYVMQRELKMLKNTNILWLAFCPHEPWEINQISLMLKSDLNCRGWWSCFILSSETSEKHTINTIFLVRRQSRKETKLLMVSFKPKWNAKMWIFTVVQNVCDHDQWFTN